MTLQETIEQIHPLSKEAMDRAKAHWDGIAKPLHSLGKLEDVLIQIAGITGKEEISIEKRALLTFCADIRRFRGIKLRMEQKIWQKVRR